MKPLAVEFLPQPLLPRWLRIALSAWLVGIAAAAVYCVDLQRRVDHLEDQLQQLSESREANAGSLPEHDAPNKPLPAYRQHALTVARQSTFPVDAPLRAMEAAEVDGVSVTAIEIDAESFNARAEVTFLDYPALLEYLERLSLHEAGTWTLRSGQRTQAEGALGMQPGKAMLEWHWPDK